MDNAPILRNWKFTALIQPTTAIDKIIEGLDESYILKDITLKANELKFTMLNYNENIGKSDIIIFLKNYTLHCNNKTLNQAIFIILQDFLGQKSLYQNIIFLQLTQQNNNNIFI